MSHVTPPPIKLPFSIEKQDPETVDFFRRLVSSFYTVWHRVSHSTFRLSIDLNTVGNVGSGEDDLMSYQLQMRNHNIGTGFRITAWGKTANNGGAKRLKLYFGSQIANVLLPANISGTWYIQGHIFIDGDDSQRYISELESVDNSGDAFTAMENGTLTESNTDLLTLKVTAEATSDDDIEQLGMIIESIN